MRGVKLEYFPNAEARRLVRNVASIIDYGRSEVAESRDGGAGSSLAPSSPE